MQDQENDYNEKQSQTFLKSQKILKRTIDSINLEQEIYTRKQSSKLLKTSLVTLSSLKKTNKIYKNLILFLINTTNFIKYLKTFKNKKNFISLIKFYLKYLKRRSLNLKKHLYLKFLFLTVMFEKNILVLSLIVKKYYKFIALRLTDLQHNKKFNNLIKKISSLLNLFSEYKNVITNKKKILNFFKRLRLVIVIYLLPFLFLSTQALIPFIPEYEESIVNPITCKIFEKIPFIISLVKFFRPITIGNDLLHLWIILGYYLIFPLGYRSLKLSYNVAYNGSIASILLIISYSFNLAQNVMRVAFESAKMIKDILFTSYLVKHLGKAKTNEREEALKIFTNLVQRYEIEIRKEYFSFLLLVHHRIFSLLALISLSALLYNCMYYILLNKNPEILFLTKAARGTIKNPQED